MKFYYLFGSEAVNLWEEHDEKVNDKFIKELINNTDFGLHFHDSNDNPNELLDAYDGWEGYVQISQTDYDKIINGARKSIKSKP